MKKRVSGQITGILTGLFLLVVGLVLIITIPILGWIVGGAMVIVGLFSGGKQNWVCTNCRAFMGRV